MHSELVSPFEWSVRNVFETMLNLRVETGTPYLAPKDDTAYDVSGIISMGGDVEGAMVLGYPMEVAKRVAGQLMGAEPDPAKDDFADAVGELSNMVCGGAKAKLAGKKVVIGCPSVVVGTGHQLRKRSDSVSIVIPCSSDCGEFSLEITVRETCDLLAKAA